MSADLSLVVLDESDVVMRSPLWEMVQEGIDINSINWSQH